MEENKTHQYTPKIRKPEVPFMCSKAEVSEILKYHQEKGKFKEDSFKLFKEILDSQPDPFVYNTFMQECQKKSYTPKMVRNDKEYFYNSFRERMYKFKKGKDWKII
jgi:hypothetical protein